MRSLFKFITANLTCQLRFDDVNASKKVRAFVFCGDNFSAGDFHGDGDFVFVAMFAIDFGNNDLSNDIFFEPRGRYLSSLPIFRLAYFLKFSSIL